MEQGKMNKGNLIYWLVLGILGVVIILGQQIAKTILYSILGVGLMVGAVACVIGWWKERSRSAEDIAVVLGAVLIFILGLWILINPDTFDKVVNVVIGAILIISGIVWLVQGIRMGRDAFMIALSVMAIILGFVIACSNAATSWVIIAEGIGLIYTAIAGFLTEKRRSSR